jgi:hypothetical protein
MNTQDVHVSGIWKDKLGQHWRVATVRDSTNGYGDVTHQVFLAKCNPKTGRAYANGRKETTREIIQQHYEYVGHASI